jgi:hypothetical protein
MNKIQKIAEEIFKSDILEEKMMEMLNSLYVEITGAGTQDQRFRTNFSKKILASDEWKKFKNYLEDAADTFIG